MYKLRFVAVVAVIAVANADSASHGSSGRVALSSRISGGQPTTIQQHPYVVSISLGSTFRCAGSILSPSYVVTSAYCVNGTIAINTLTVRTGSTRWRDGGSARRVEKIIVHEEYAELGNYTVNDIALLEVSPPFELDQNSQTIETFGANEQVWTGTLASVTGWGRTEFSSTIQETLRSVDTRIISKHDCNLTYQTKYGDVPKGLICSGGGVKNVCNGDVGGPLTVGGRLVGIASHFNECASSSLPGLFAKLADHYDWIDQYLYA